VKILGNVYIGNQVKIKANSVVGAEGLTTNRTLSGESIDLPQFGGVEIHDNVYIGANTVIARGAIDNTIICEGVKIDNLCFISHNVYIGKHTFIVGETIFFGSSSIGDYSYVSGNSTIRNGVKIGNYVTIGMGSVVTKNIESGLTVFGNPARSKQNHE
jgi:UDP-3-O-[3-hydroxymyristoyl] glucosamine N-acyltransferase